MVRHSSQPLAFSTPPITSAAAVGSVKFPWPSTRSTPGHSTRPRASTPRRRNTQRTSTGPERAICANRAIEVGSLAFRFETGVKIPNSAAIGPSASAAWPARRLVRDGEILSAPRACWAFGFSPAGELGASALFATSGLFGTGAFAAEFRIGAAGELSGVEVLGTAGFFCGSGTFWAAGVFCGSGTFWAAGAPCEAEVLCEAGAWWPAGPRCAGACAADSGCRFETSCGD